jgi:hypothetical protein
VSAERTVRTLAWLARESPSDALLVADLAGEPTGLLGAFQRPGRSGEPCELRGSCGGRSALLGPGSVLVCARVVDPGAWLAEPATRLSAARLLNRLVRGVLAGLTPIGVDASYPGRDFVVAGGRRIAQLALGRDARGALSFQAVCAAERPVATREPDPGFPGLPALPPPGAPGIPAAQLAEGLARGFAARFGLALEPGEAGQAEPPPLVDPELLGLAAGEPVATPIGELVAHVALATGGSLARVRLRGDFMAAAGALRELEDSLAGLDPADARVRELAARWLSAPEGSVVGVTDAGAIAEAVAVAASHSSSSP